MNLTANDFHKISDKNNFLYRLELAINHEQQHQELLLTDLKHIFFESPLQPTYIENNGSLKPGVSDSPSGKPVFYDFPESLFEIGYSGSEFCYDNELGRHKVFLNSFSLMNRPVSCGEYMEFIETGGYRQFQWWLSDGWAAVQNGQWEKPLYWEKIGQKWYEFTLYGFREIDENSPIFHVSFFEADAFARFKGMRLPTEFEWEYAAANHQSEIQTGHFQDNRIYHPTAENAASENCANFFGNIWEWTQSSYLPYPHYKAPPGAIGEYNGKFMNDQRVLRGGSCVTPRDHIRLSYRNFFESFQRWQFSGFRLARDI
jgi:ergothioneine biosynthesis protein EgtB